MPKNPVRNYAIDYVGKKDVSEADALSIAIAAVAAAADPAGDPLGEVTDGGDIIATPSVIPFGADELDYRVTADDQTGPAPAAPLTFVTYDSSGELVHPSIVFKPEGWNGYRYWLAATPYPGGDDTLENPSIWVSNDGETWDVPPGVTNPLVDYDGVSNNSDTHLAFGPDGELNLFYRVGAGRLYVITSLDGVLWTDPVEVFTDSGALSPSFMYDKGEWVCWYVDVSTTPNTLKRRTAAAVDGTWSSADTATLTSLPGGREAWHVFVTRLGAQFVALLNDTPIGTSGGLGNEYFMTSLDGLDWTIGAAVCLPQSGSWYDYPYRATMIPSLRDGVLGFDVWFSAYDTTGPVWQVGRTFLEPPPVVTISTDDPQPDGTADPGATGEVSDAGHVHPATDSGAHYLVIASAHSTPLVFDDIVQSSAGDDFVYTS